MDSGDKKPTRGRPKTFERDHVLGISMRAYWQDGHDVVSLNSVCQRARVAKTSLYKEFGSEDGLKQAVLVDYHKMTLAPLYEILDGDQPFENALHALSAYILRDHEELGMPNGCLFVDMCQSRDRLGDLTGQQVDQFRELSLTTFEKWIERAISTGQLNSSVSPRTAAVYIDAQIATIMNMQKQGASLDEVSDVFRLALSVFK